MHIDQLNKLTQIKISKLNFLLLQLELKGIISADAGRKYSFKGLQNLLKPI